LKKSHRKLSANNNYIPAGISCGDELFPNGIFEFNITRMIEFIRSNEADIELVDIVVEKYHAEAFSSINEDHIQSVDLSSPIVLVEINPERYAVVDGHHRLEKAYRNGIKTIRAYKLTVESHLQFLTSVNAYRAFIEYWNGKITE
jgi:hypothetical protein